MDNFWEIITFSVLIIIFSENWFWSEGTVITQLMSEHGTCGHAAKINFPFSLWGSWSRKFSYRGQGLFSQEWDRCSKESLLLFLLAVTNFSVLGSSPHWRGSQPSVNPETSCAGLLDKERLRIAQLDAVMSLFL